MENHACGSSVDAGVLVVAETTAEDEIVDNDEDEIVHLGNDQEGEEEEEETLAETNGEVEIVGNGEVEIVDNREEQVEEEERSRQHEASTILGGMAVSHDRAGRDLDPLELPHLDPLELPHLDPLELPVLPQQPRSPPTLAHLSFYAAQQAITVMNVQQDIRFMVATTSPPSNNETHPSQQTQQQASSNPPARSEPQHQNPPQQPNQQRQISIRQHHLDNQPSTSTTSATSATPATPDTPETRRWHPRPGFESRNPKSPRPSVSASTQTAITNPPTAFSRGQWVRVNGQRVPLRQYTLETRPNPPLAQIIRNPMFPAELLNQIRAAARDAAPARDATSAGSVGSPPGAQGTQGTQGTQTTALDAGQYLAVTAGHSRDVDTGEEQPDAERPLAFLVVATDVDGGEQEEVTSQPAPRALARPSGEHDVDLGEAQDEEEAELRRRQQLVERSHDVEEEEEEEEPAPPRPMRTSTDVDLGDSHEEEQNRNNQRRRPDQTGLGLGLGFLTQTTQTSFTQGSVFDPPVLHLYPLQAMDATPLQYFPFPLPPARLVPLYNPYNPYNQIQPPQQQRNHNPLFQPFHFLQVFQSYGVRGSPSWPQDRERRNHRRHSANSNLESEL